MILGDDPKMSVQHLIESIAQESASLAVPEWLKVDENWSSAYYRFLYLIADRFRPSLMVELGTWRGTSSMCLAEGNPSGQVVTIDIGDQVYEKTRRPNVTYLLGDSLKPTEHKGIELLFIDTEHNGLQPLMEFQAWYPKLARRAIVFFDDISLNERMREFWTSFNPGHPKISLPVHGDAGFGAVYVNKEACE